MNQKGISAILIILIIVGVLVLGGGIWYYLTIPIGPGLEPDETVAWQTYRNEEYGFEVKYPPTLKVWENQQSGKAVYGVSFENPLADQTTAGRKIVFSVSVFNNATQLQDAFSANSDPYRLRINQGEVTVGGYQAQKILFKPKDTKDIEATIYLIDDKSTAVMLFGTDYHKISEADISQILSTFKFVKTQTNGQTSVSPSTKVEFQEIAISNLLNNPIHFLDTKVQVTGKLINTASSYFRSPEFALTDGTNNFPVTAWAPLEVPPSLHGSSVEAPLTMQFYLNKTVTVQGIVKEGPFIVKGTIQQTLYLNVTDLISVK